MKNDIFPDWLPPALVKDLRQMLRSAFYLLGVLAKVRFSPHAWGWSVV